VLDFDGEIWWEKIKKEEEPRRSGPRDKLPENRFIKKSSSKFLWLAAAAVIVIAYLAFQLPKISGKPSITITFPIQNPYSTSSSTVTISGFVKNANSLLLNGDPVTIASDDSWEKAVLLQNGLNTFQISAKKLLGGETDFIEQIIYQPPASSLAPRAPTSSLGTQLPTSTVLGTSTGTH
jgi:hypothetical protein